MIPGTRVGPYEVVTRIGAGGMGEVYRARDTSLGRDVALKVLPAAFVADADRLARFNREARLLASLNHPNIAAIYGLEALPPAEGAPSRQRALVLELVDGESLTDTIARVAGSRETPGRIRDTLTIARQICDALDAAHERGVIHRDLKPPNIKLTTEGVVKVLDFGLARTAGPDPDPAPSADAAPTVTSAETRAGLVLGTAAYMSPEQARGRPLDKRTDIWSFGCVLYEMLTGHRPFDGETIPDVIAAVLEREPDMSRLPGATPPNIRRLLERCFEKDPRHRLRDIGDARAEIDDALAPGSAAREPVAVSAPLRTHPPLWMLAAALALAVVAAAAGWLVGRQDIDNDAPVFDRIVRLVSTPAHEFGPAISPDGKWVAYLSDARGPTDVWVKFIAGGDPANLTSASGIDVQANDYMGGLDVSPDGSEIAFTTQGPGQNFGTAAWVIPAPLGGVARRVLADGNTSLHWSPDSTRIVFMRAGGSLGDALVVSDPDGQNERIVVKRQGAAHFHWPRWSSDGQHIYFNYAYNNFNIEPTQTFRVPAAGGDIEPVVPTARRAAFPLPTPDGRGLIYGGNPDSADLSLWWRDLRTGRTVRLTSGVGEYTHPSLSADGQRLVGTVIDSRQALERVTVAFDRPVALEPMTDGYSGDIDPMWSPDGSRIFFSTLRTGNRTIWAARADMSQPAPITSGAAIDEWPAVSPDGRQIAFVSDRGGDRGIWIVGADGGVPRLLARAAALDTLSWSPDGTRLVYSAPVGDAPGLTILNVADGTTTHLPTPGAATAPAWSRDDVIAFVEPRGGDRGAFAQLIRSDGQRVESSPLDAPDAPRITNGFIAWSPDGRRLAAVSLAGAAAGSIWIIDPQSPTPYRKLMDLPSGVFVRGLT